MPHYDRKTLWSIIGSAVLALTLITAAARLFGPGPYANAGLVVVVAATTVAFTGWCYAQTTRSRLSRTLHLTFAASVIPAYGTALCLCLLNPSEEGAAGAGVIMVIHIVVTGLSLIMGGLFLEQRSQGGALDASH